jgi:hypothetical protein
VAGTCRNVAHWVLISFYFHCHGPSGSTSTGGVFPVNVSCWLFLLVCCPLSSFLAVDHHSRSQPFIFLSRMIEGKDKEWEGLETDEKDMRDYFHIMRNFQLYSRSHPCRSVVGCLSCFHLTKPSSPLGSRGPHPSHQYQTENVNHLSGPLKYPTWVANIRLKISTT